MMISEVWCGEDREAGVAPTNGVGTQLPGRPGVHGGQAMQPAVTPCAAAYGLTGVLIGIGGTALGILAITNPGGS